MKYHVIAHYNGDKRYWWNYSKDKLIEQVLLPFIQKEIRIVTRGTIRTIFNFGTVSYFTILATESSIKKDSSIIPSELKDVNFIKEHSITEEFINEIRLISSSLQTRSVLQYALREPLNQIFVIMKFGDEELDSAFHGVIKPLGKEFGFDVIRVDEIQDSGNINQQILENISKSKLIIADLSGERPNCYYEAGFAHALGKEVIFSIKSGNKIHFDLVANRFIQWRTENDYRVQLRARLSALTEGESN